jgi:hypothetical protein
MKMPNNIDPLIDRWIGDPAFRAAMRANPEAAARAAGVALSADERAAMRSMDWGQSDTQLMERMSRDDDKDPYRDC